MRSPLETPSGTSPAHTWTPAVTLTLTLRDSQWLCSLSVLVTPESRKPKPSRKPVHLSRIPLVPLISPMPTASYLGRLAPGSGKL